MLKRFENVGAGTAIEIPLGSITRERDESPGLHAEQIDFSGLEVPLIKPVIDLFRREQLYRRSLAAADAASALIAVLLCVGLWHAGFTWRLASVPVFAVFVAKISGLYARDELVIQKSTISEWRQIVRAAMITGIGIYLSWPLLTNLTEAGGMGMFLLLVCTISPLAIFGRMVARSIARSVCPAERCLIVSDAAGAAALASRLADIDGVEPIGAVSTADVERLVGDLQSIVNELQVHRLVIGPTANEADLDPLIRSAKWLGVRVSLMPGVMNAVGGCTVFDNIDGLTLLGVPRFGLSRSSQALKRAFDLIVTVTTLILIAPIMLTIAALIRLDSRGPVFFRQTRVGRNGRHFQIYKFRSMVDGADAMKGQLLERNEAGEGLFKIADDPRVTGIGRHLRRTHLDELPQLINVLRGEMSLVGPRPLIVEEDARLTGGDRQRLRLTPGITGPWQIHGPMTTPLSEMARLDYMYISSWSLWQDIDILVRTGVHVLDRGGH